MDTLRYDYKPKAYVMALSGLLFAGVGVLLAKEASDNDRGLVLNGIVSLDTGEATGFYWVLTACCVLFVLAAIFGLVRAMGAPQQVVLDPTAITAPKAGLAGSLVTIPYASITDLRAVQVGSQKMLTIHHRDGKLTLQRSMLPQREDFETILEALHQRCAARGR